MRLKRFERFLIGKIGHREGGVRRDLTAKYAMKPRGSQGRLLIINFSFFIIKPVFFRTRKKIPSEP